MISFEVGGSIFNYRVSGLAVDGNRVLLHRAEIDDSCRGRCVRSQPNPLTLSNTSSGRAVGHAGEGVTL